MASRFPLIGAHDSHPPFFVCVRPRADIRGTFMPITFAVLDRDACTRGVKRAAPANAMRRCATAAPTSRVLIAVPICCLGASHRGSTSPRWAHPLPGVEASPTPVLIRRDLNDRALRRPDGFTARAPEFVPIYAGRRNRIPPHAESRATDALYVGEPNILFQRATVYLYFRTGRQGLSGQRSESRHAHVRPLVTSYSLSTLTRTTIQTPALHSRRRR